MPRQTTLRQSLLSQSVRDSERHFPSVEVIEDSDSDVIISPSPSDNDEASTSDLHPLAVASSPTTNEVNDDSNQELQRHSIREMILRAKRLLLEADALSQQTDAEPRNLDEFLCV